MEAMQDLVIPDATRRFKAEWDAAGKPYHMTEREYFSTGSVIFAVDGSPVTVAGQYPRYVLRAQASQQANLFAYKQGDPMKIANVTTNAGAGTRNATPADTNMLVAYETNNEDFAVRGIAFQAAGFRLEFTAGTDDYPALPTDFNNVIQKGEGFLTDPGSIIMPPEIDSPLILQDVLGRQVSKGLLLREVWDNRASDDIAFARRLGPGGSESYLKSLGEPTPWNVLRLDPGLMWRMSRSNRDTRFNILATLEEDIWTVVSWPQALVAAGDVFGTLTRVHFDYRVVLVGNAFYYPSANA